MDAMTEIHTWFLVVITVLAGIGLGFIIATFISAYMDWRYHDH